MPNRVPAKTAFLPAARRWVFAPVVAAFALVMASVPANAQAPAQAPARAQVPAGAETGGPAPHGTNGVVDTAGALRRLEQILQAQAARLEAQERALAEQRTRLERQNALLAEQNRLLTALRSPAGEELPAARGPGRRAQGAAPGRPARVASARPAVQAFATAPAYRLARQSSLGPSSPSAPGYQLARVSSLDGLGGPMRVLAQAQLPPSGPRVRGVVNPIRTSGPSGPSADGSPSGVPGSPAEAGAPGADGLPQGPVGEAPPPAPPIAAAALPEGAGVLTPRGQWVFDPSVEYSRSSSNRLVFRGVQIIEGFQIGRIEASDADRNTGAFTAGLRYGLTNRLEVEARVPFVRRSDRVMTLVRQEEMQSRTFDLDGSGVGDVELAARYQLPHRRSDRPIWIAGLRLKTDTGTGPFDVDRDEFGVSTELPTGSGFWAVEPSLTFLYPTDPAVIFGGLSYLAHLPKDVDTVIGAGESAVRIGAVDPGDSIGLNLGFGFALNPSFSLSLGYRHNYIFSTETELNDLTERSQALQVGVFTFGGSYRLSERSTLSTAFEIGATDDAPDVRIVVRTPLRFGRRR